MSYYVDGPGGHTAARPLLLVHSVNAAASAYEVRTIYEHYRRLRWVYAPDLPGFGFSERGDRAYTPRLMTDAIHAVAEEIRRAHGPGPVDALALSLGCEFLARAAVETPRAFASLALVSPTGFDGTEPRLGAEGSTRGMPWLKRAFDFPLWSDAFFRLLTSRASIRFFLEKTWGGKAIDEGFAEYAWLTAHQPGARYAPYCFVSGFLFSNDIGRVYAGLVQPVWMSHGVRGDFTDYRCKRAFEGRPNWRFSVFPTGALPHFEVPGEFMAAYDAFLSA